MANNGVPVLPRQAIGSLDDAPAGYLEIVAADGTGKLASVDENGLVTEYGTGTAPQENVYYFGSAGSDSNTGKTPGQAVLTITYAISLAVAQTPSAIKGFSVVCLDAEIYTESFAIPSYINVWCPNATLIGNVTCSGFGGLTCLNLIAVSGVAFTKDSDNDSGSLTVGFLSGNGTTVGGVECAQGGLIIHVGILTAINGVAVHNSGLSCHLHGNIATITISGSGTGIKTSGESSEASLFVSEIIAPSGTGIDLDDGHLHTTIGELNVGTGGDVATGSELTAFVADLYGNTFTGSGEIKVTEAGVIPLHGPSHTSGQTDAIKLDDFAAPDDNADLNVGLSAHGLMVKLPGGTDTFFRADGSYAQPPVGVALGSSWKFDDTTADADPGSKKFRMNSGTQSSSTFLYVNNTSESGVDFSAALLTMTTGDRIYLQEERDSTRYHLCTLTGNAVDATTYVKLPITINDSGSDLQDTKVTGFLIVTGHAAAAPPTVLQGSEDAEDSTTSLTYVQAYRFSPTLEASTKYILWYDSEISGDSATYWAQGRLQIDDTVTVSEMMQEIESTSNDEWWKMSGVYFLTTTTAKAYNFDFDFKTQDDGEAAYLRNKRIVLMKVVE